MSSGKVICKRIYDHETVDGFRVLADRLWPRGIRKEDAGIDFWAKEIAPSNELRKWFGHVPERFDEFSEKYCQELDGNPAVESFALMCRKKLSEEDLILLYAARDEKRNHAVVLRKRLLEMWCQENEQSENGAFV